MQFQVLHLKGEPGQDGCDQLVSIYEKAGGNWKRMRPEKVCAADHLWRVPSAVQGTSYLKIRLFKKRLWGTGKWNKKKCSLYTLYLWRFKLPWSVFNFASSFPQMSQLMLITSPFPALFSTLVCRLTTVLGIQDKPKKGRFPSETGIDIDLKRNYHNFMISKYAFTGSLRISYMS